MSTYVTHAQTPEQLKDEVCTDIRRRIERIEGQVRLIVKSSAEKSRLGQVIIELKDMLAYWEALQIVRAKRKRAVKSAG